MKVKIIQADGTVRTCPKCGGQHFRHSHRSRITARERIEGNTDANPNGHFKEYGEHYELIICVRCGEREKRNVIAFHTINRGG